MTNKTNGNGLISFKLTTYTSQNSPEWAKYPKFFPNNQTCVFVKEITDKYQPSSPSVPPPALVQPTPTPIFIPPTPTPVVPTPTPVPPTSTPVPPTPIPVQPTPTPVPPTPIPVPPTPPTPASNSQTQPGLPMTMAENLALGNSLKANAEALINDFKVRNGLTSAPGNSSNNTGIEPA